MLNVIIALLIFGFLILIHELGHYTMARVFKVGINEFSVGMGPKVVSKKSKKTGIAYSLRLLPIGGFVSMDGEDEDSGSENSLSSKPVWQRFFIMVAGAVMNILVGIVLTCVIVCRSQALGSTVVASFSENASSQTAGLAEGDMVQAGDVIGFMGRTGYSDRENVNNIETVHLHFGLELVFDESQKECNSEIWINVYDIVRLLSGHRSSIQRTESGWGRVYPYQDLDWEEYPKVQP